MSLPDQVTAEIADLIKKGDENDSSGAGDTEAERSEPLAADETAAADAGGDENDESTSEPGDTDTGSAGGEDEYDTGSDANAESSSDSSDAAEADEPGENLELDLSALAEKLGVEVADLYAVEIPMGQDNGAMTLGQMKDRFNELANLDGARESLEEQGAQQQNDLLLAQQELQTVLQYMGEIPPELLQRAQADMQRMVHRERELLLNVMPEWRDPDTLRSDRESIQELARGYGFSDAELANVYDHRLLKMLKDMVGMKGRISAARETVEEGRVINAPGKPGKKGPDSKRVRRGKTIQRARQSRSNTDKVAGVKALLNP